MHKLIQKITAYALSTLYVSSFRINLFRRQGCYVVQGYFEVIWEGLLKVANTGSLEGLIKYLKTTYIYASGNWKITDFSNSFPNYQCLSYNVKLPQF